MTNEFRSNDNSFVATPAQRVARHAISAVALQVDADWSLKRLIF